MNTDNIWRIGDRARLTKVEIDGEPEYYVMPLVHGGCVGFPAQAVPDNALVEITEVGDCQATVRIVEGNANGSYATVLRTRLRSV
jgi:hypothetical protein